jgi:hypothetical protein
MSSSYGALNQKYNTLLALVLEGTGGGSGGSQNLNEVLFEGNTTTRTAIFNSVGGNTTTVASGGVGVASTGGITNSVTSGTILMTNTTSNKSIDIDNSIANPHIRIIQNTNNNHYATLDHDSLFFKPAGAVNPITGISANTTTNGVTITTGGTLTLDGLTGSDTQVLTYNSGNAVWADATGNSTLTDVLTAGPTTSLTATFTDANETTTISPLGIEIKDDSDVLDIVNQLSTNAISLSNLNTGTGASLNIQTNPYVEVRNNLAGYTATINTNSFVFTSGTPPSLTSQVGLQTLGTGLQINTNGELTLNGLSDGSDGKLLTYSSGKAVWATAPASSTVQSGIISNPVYSATTPTLQSFGTAYVGLNPPSVTLTVNTGVGSTAIVVAGLAGYTSTGSGSTTNWTGFYWFISGSVPTGGTLNWIAD